jgi:hypothetical protein
VLYLSSVSTPEADDSPDLAAIDKRYEVQNSRLRSERDHAHLAIVFPVIDPYQRVIPIEFGRKSQRQSMLGLVQLILVRVEVDLHYLL